MQVLNDQGWQNYYNCMCGGAPKQYWSNTNYPGYEIRIRPRRQTFSIVRNNMVIHGPNYTYRLEEKLKEYEIFKEPIQEA